MNISREQALSLIKNNPIEIGHWVGFKDLTEMHNDWLKHFLFDEEDQTLQAHRGSFKTTTLSLFFAIHCVTSPNEILMYFRKTGGDVAEIARQAANILDSGCMHEIVRAIYGFDLKVLKASGTEIHTNLATSIKGSAQIVGLGIGVSITGKHADIVVTDDIVNVNDRVSQAERERTKIAYMELQNIKNRGGRFINTGTPWHKDDAFQLMPNPRKFPWDKTGLITPEQAKDIKAHMTNSLFAANYELKHIASDDVIFANPQTGADLNLVQQGIGHIDAAYYGEDFTAYSLIRLIDGKYYVYGKLWRRHIDDVLEQIIAIHHSMNGGKIYCEENGDKGYLGRDLRKRGERVVIYTESMNKYLKITSYLKFVWERVIFVQGTDPEYIEQIESFNDNAEHDDAPDSLASLIRAMPKEQKSDGYADLWRVFK